MKRIIIIVIIATLILVGLFFYFALPEKNADVNFSVIQVTSKASQATLYIKKKVWGMTSDNQIVVISNSNNKNFSPESTKNYIYEGIMPLFYKLQQDTLFIYTLKTSPVPKDLKTKIKIIQVELENSEMMKLIQNDNYKNEGLIAID